MEEYIDLEKALGVAIKAARSAGDIMREFYQLRREDTAAKVTRETKEGSFQTPSGADAPLKPSPLQLLDIKSKSAANDLVTHYDTLCDETIMKTLQRYDAKVENEKQKAGFELFQFRFITEEISPDTPLTDDPTWIVDPIDGTTAFVHGGCECCVSIGLTIKKRTVLAVVYCPFIGSAPHMMCDSSPTAVPVGELYTAIRGKGAFLNGQAIRVAADVAPTTSLVTFNCPTRVKLSMEEMSNCKSQWETLRQAKHQRALDANGHIRQELALIPVQGIRSYGACAFILAQIAAGRVDLYMEPAGMIWDVCAGSLLVTEAGGVVQNMWGREFGMEGTTTIVAAANEALAKYGVKLCKEVNYADFWKP
ncbi:myo-inositol-1 phosphatase [Trypanosoma rangeli]|uniref:Inositol-1-monophosphatase n=1 Tax=Trypanosoma rangeli TaxID=5698 RepID=A0A422NRH4_TRYRA|nr:myo-inositol-1 phosphatase [Trypanosoma rangeli]RNF08009.1 myo-inositol-1 phosphatase [Trypanosoma rangeli]|eukprot:RNF08009.1 myo-inositol-1 phosphatase [Trypanosoma rangeli]